jgi:putative ABC transport system permease protein
MYKNYLKVAIRHLWKNKSVSAINIIGLATGLAVCVLIVLFVFDEIQYDAYNTNADRIYRLDADISFNGTRFNSATSPKPLAPKLTKDYPQIEQMVRLSFQNDILVRKGNQAIQEHHAVFADSTFFKVFTAPMLAGDPLTALTEPHSIVINETIARRYFNSTDVVGKTLYLNNTENCRITGVIKDFPRQSHFNFSFIRPFSDAFAWGDDDWATNGTHSYILAKPGVTQAGVQSCVDVVVNTMVAKQLEAMMHTTAREMKNKGDLYRYHVTPLRDIHLRSDKLFEFEPNGNINYVYIFSVTAIFILMIACINFMNLSTARSAGRAKEIGIRKIAGSTRGNLVIQFLVESVLMSYFSLALALLMASLLLPVFNQIAGKQMQLSTLFATGLLPALIGLAFVVGCVAGSYPAFYLSSFQPILVLKDNRGNRRLRTRWSVAKQLRRGSVATGFKSSWLRSSLVVLQFSISIILIVGTLIIYSQLDYIRSRKTGFNREQVLVIHNTENLGQRIKAFREELLKLPGVENAAISGDLPTAGSGVIGSRGWFPNAAFDVKKVLIMTSIDVDEHYIPTLDMQLLKGRNFSAGYGADSSGIILNETAVKMLGIKDALGARLYRPDDNNKTTEFHVIGVVGDFNYSSMHEKIGPLVMCWANNSGNIAVRFNAKETASLISHIGNEWASLAAGLPFSYTFMDSDFNDMYFAEQRTGKLFVTFAVFAIFIACLGLFGLITYAAEQRTREIGIRKVLGAGVSRIVAMLSKEYLGPVSIAMLIGFPVAWWAMQRWLESFAYRIQIHWWIFMVAGLTTLVIAVITVGLQAVKAAVANPIKSLRSE